MAFTLIASFHGWLDRWAPLADWVVAAGTLTLAIATFVLARRARQEGDNVRADVELQREAMEQGSRAYIFPHAPWDWASGSGFWSTTSPQSRLPLKNGGPGLARNVHGKVYWDNDGQRSSFTFVTLFGSSIGPGDEIQARLSASAGAGWAGAEGYVLFTDLANVEWITEFKFTLGDGNQLDAHHEAPVRTSDFGDIGQHYPPR
jgi:type II secretory pathway pseudopilin PulG